MVLKGVQTKIVTQTRSVVGKHKKTEREKIVKQGKGQSFPNFSSSDMFYFDSQTEMILVGKKTKNTIFERIFKTWF